MESIQKCQDGLESILKVDGAQRNAARGMLKIAHLAHNSAAVTQTR